MTNEDTTPVEQGTNDVSTEGTGTTQSQAKSEEKMLSQSEVNKLVAKARQEGRDSGKLTALKDFEGKHVLTEDELDTRLKAAVDIALKERDLADVKRAIQSEYGLTDAQLSKLNGDDEKSLRSDAETTFGALKQKKAPDIKTGNVQSDKEEISTPNKDLNDWLKAGIKTKYPY